MFDILKSLSRAVLAFLSGAFIICGFFFFSDGVSGYNPQTGYGLVWTEILGMLNKPNSLYVFVLITALAAYVLGIINVAASGLLFSRVWKNTVDDLVIIGQVEGLRKPELLKETLDYLYIKRALVAWFFPLLIFGVGLAFDQYEWKQAPGIRIAAGTALALMGILAPILAVQLDRHLQIAATKFPDESHGRKQQSDPNSLRGENG